MDGQKEREQNEVTKLTQMKSKVNRLRRSPRSATQNPARVCQTAEFKTPTRPARGQFRRLIPEDSPNNDPDFHQDIIWDTTSPSPVRNGRGQRRPAKVRSVDISDIANRIAPKNCRLETADASLLQWIGDSSIPCTPEVQQPKVKTVSAKQSTVEDLMRLAKQFDFNMRQDEAQLHSDGPGSKSAVEQGLEHFDNRPTTAHSGLAIKAGTVVLNNGKPVDDRALNQETDNDLDFLFDGPTQQLSGRLSQMSGYRTQDVPERVTEKNLDVVMACDSEKPSSSSSLSVAANDSCKQVNNANDFADDWNNDSFLEDSLVFEMTQNPDLFAAPRGCSTQKPTAENWNNLNSNARSSATMCKPQDAKMDVKCSTPQGQREKNRRTFQLGSFRSDHQIQAKPHGGFQRTGCHMDVNNTSQSCPTSKSLAVPSSHNEVNQNQPYQHKSETQQLPVNKNSSGSNKVSSTHIQSNTKDMPLSTSLYTAKPSHSESASTNLTAGAVKQVEDAITGQDGFSDVLDEDLDLFFTSDDIWDEGVEDDDLFCEVCDHLELSGNPTHHVDSITTKHQQTSKTQPKAPPSATSQNKTHIRSEMASQQIVFAHPNPPRKPPPSSANTSGSLNRPKGHAVHSGPVGLNTNVPFESARAAGPSSNGAYTFKPLGCSSLVGGGTCASGPAQQGRERSVLVPLQSDVWRPESHQFKTSYSPSVSSAPVSRDLCNTAAVRCSDAEIERKKQQAMERRRLRMMTSQNLRAPV